MFAFDDAAAITSARRPASPAAYPIAVRASVTMSEVVARSSPEAAARFIIPSMPFSMSFTSHPAIAIYWNASALSEAEKMVVSPISFAFSVSWSSSSPVAPEIAPTLLIDCSKFIPTEIVSFASSLNAETAFRMPSATRFASAPFMTVKPSETCSVASFISSIVSV